MFKSSKRADKLIRHTVRPVNAAFYVAEGHLCCGDVCGARASIHGRGWDMTSLCSARFRSVCGLYPLPLGSVVAQPKCRVVNCPAGCLVGYPSNGGWFQGVPVGPMALWGFCGFVLSTREPRMLPGVSLCPCGVSCFLAGPMRYTRTRSSSCPVLLLVSVLDSVPSHCSQCPSNQPDVAGRCNLLLLQTFRK